MSQITTLVVLLGWQKMAINCTNSGRLTQWRVLGEALNTHGFSRNHGDDGSITRLESFGVVLKFLTGTTIYLLLQLAEFAGNVSSVTIQHRSVTLWDLARVIQDDDLQRKRHERRVREQHLRSSIWALSWILNFGRKFLIFIHFFHLNLFCWVTDSPGQRSCQLPWVGHSCCHLPRFHGGFP